MGSEADMAIPWYRRWLGPGLMVLAYIDGVAAAFMAVAGLKVASTWFIVGSVSFAIAALWQPDYSD
jgi:hypothetical protein